MRSMPIVSGARCLKMDPVFQEFRARFIGKVSPVHFFWGSFDVAVTRFSGRPAPPRDGADMITREAYSHEVISHGFWPGNKDMEAAFYSYTAPEPAGWPMPSARERFVPAETFYSAEMKEFFLPYDAVTEIRLTRNSAHGFLPDYLRRRRRSR